MIGRDPKWIAAQIGHTSPSFTFSVYQQVATRRYVDEQAVWSLMRFADERSECAPSRQLTRAETSETRRPQLLEAREFDRAVETPQRRRRVAALWSGCALDGTPIAPRAVFGATRCHGSFVGSTKDQKIQDAALQVLLIGTAGF